MENFIEYQIFSSLEEARILTDILEVNQIPYKVGNRVMPSNIAETSFNTFKNGIVIHTREEDVERVDKLNQRTPEPFLDNDHYLHLMPDDFIVEAVINPMEWTNEEHLLAKEILKLRNIEIGQK